MTPRDDSEARGDLVDQATDAIFAAEQAAIRAALAGRRTKTGGDSVEFQEHRDG